MSEYDYTSPMVAEGKAIRVEVTDLATDAGEVAVIWDDYSIVTAGGCEVTDVQIYRQSDGTQTQVLTIKGVRRD